MVGFTSLLLIILMTVLSTTLAMECPAYPLEDWTCSDYDKLFAGYGSNLASGLACLDYDKYIGPEMLPGYAQDLVNVSVGFTHINKLDDGHEVLDLGFWYLSVWLDPRLPIPVNCVANKTLQYENAYPGYYLDGYHVENNLWVPPVDLMNVMEMKTQYGFA